MDKSEIIDFIHIPLLQQICEAYLNTKSSQNSNKLNVFTIASDLYYRENFHSDIISAFLDPSYNHNMGPTCLYAFIEMLNNFFGNKICINKKDYREASVKRESNRIDILIQSESNKAKHCIIIENKMNNAVDMKRQIPRYFDLMVKQGFIVDAIVYIPLEDSKTPNQSSWTKTDKTNVNPRLVILPAYSEVNSPNLVEDWIQKCILLTKNIDCISIFSQYAELIKKLNHDIMGSVMLEKLYNELIQFEKPQSVQTLSEMLGKIPEHMANRLLNHYKNRIGDFYNIWKYKSNYFVLDFTTENHNIAIDVIASLKGYHISVFCRNGNIKELVERKPIKMLDKFNLKDDDRYHNEDFGFQDEQKVIDWIEDFYKEMKK